MTQENKVVTGSMTAIVRVPKAFEAKVISQAKE